MRGKKRLALIIVGLVLLLAGLLLVIRMQKDEPDAAIVSNPSGAPAFEVRVEKSRLNRPLFGLLPERLFGIKELRFDHTSSGATFGNVRPDRLELRADGWDFLIAVDGQGGIARGTHLVFPIELANKQQTLRCRPADNAVGYLRTASQTGSGELDGAFVVELAKCENVETGKILEWPSRPLTVRGSSGACDERKDEG